MIEAICFKYQDEGLLLATGFDDALLGVDEQAMRLIYSKKKCIELLMQHMSEEDAREYFDFNISGSYVGEHTPIWCEDDF